LVLTDNSLVFNYVLWPLNDPQLRGDTVYALAPGSADVARLRTEFPGRAMYELALGPQGDVSFIPLGR